VDRGIRATRLRGPCSSFCYVFSPDLMSLLVDETGDLDVKIVDDMFFAYAAVRHRGARDVGEARPHP